MHRYKIQHWGWQQAWFDVVVWEMEPHLLSDFLTHINPCGGDMNDRRLIRTNEEPIYRFLGGHVSVDLRPFDVIEAIERENEEFREYFKGKQETDPDYCISRAIDEFYQNRE